MDYLIDTNWFVDQLADDSHAQQFLARLAGRGFAMSIITYMELFQGTVEASDPTTARAKLEDLISVVPVLAFTREAAKACARIRATLKANGKRVRPRALDLQIAATALVNGLTLVTQNVDDYKDIEGLSLYQPS